MHDAFLSAFQQLDELQDPLLFPAWLKRMTINKAVNALKKRQIYFDFVHAIDTETDDEPDTTEDNAALKVAQVKKAIEALPDGYRTVVTLYLLEGYDHEEIGEILGISSATSRSQFNRGKNKLKSLLKRQP